MKKTHSPFTFEPIGVLESCYKDKFGVPRQSGLVKAATARLKLRADLHPDQALQGLHGFSHVWLIWVFHENRTARYHAKVHPPRLGGESLGVFATRSPHRPNPIGLSLVEIIAIEGDTLFLAGIDVMDGTPVLDLKPYLPGVEALPEARAGWMPQASGEELRVSWTASAEEAFQEWRERLRRRGLREEAERLREIITDTIRLDPRPVLYRGGEGDGGYQRRPNHAFRLYDGDVHFVMTGAGQAEIFEIRPLHDEFPPANLRNFDPSIKSGGVVETPEREGKNHGTHGNVRDQRQPRQNKRPKT
ncbi:MAG: tRNA (N6-threonylcarbamoyladenosine(37)-N6)-methyltransferase TrmO [Bdellovibrionaceae bacterium]|nr:tRNA (N6-threonylcarbamoyladenosine(37)-N6)-methyltransferase TrmO [Pseudobdellovibrionaceae bacterium]